MIVQVRRLTKTFAGVAAIRDACFRLQGGEILGCLGPNGAGKSTTVKMLAGLLEPSRGEVLFDGVNLFENLTECKRRIGYVPEQGDLYPFLSGWEYLELVATLRGLDEKQSMEKAATLLKELSLLPYRHCLIGSYSKGMRQRILLISALLHNPDFLILDEPFAGLDTTTALIIRAVIERLAAAGKAILFSSPVLEEMERLCTHLLVLKRGAVTAQGSMEEIRAGFARGGFERAFLDLSDQVDTASVADHIVSQVCQ